MLECGETSEALLYLVHNMNLIIADSTQSSQDAAGCFD